AQRRHADHDDAQVRQQLAAHGLAALEAGERAAEDSHVQRTFARLAVRMVAALLESSEQQALTFRRNVAELLEEQHPAFRALERSGPFAIAEQLRLSIVRAEIAAHE